MEQVAKAGRFLPAVQRPSEQVSLTSPTDGQVSEVQALWLSFRRQVNSDQAAIERVNQWLDLKPPLTEPEIKYWWTQEKFQDLANSVLETPPTTSFLSLTEQLFPVAFRTLHSMLTSKDVRAQGKGLELLLKMNGMLIERVKTDTPETIAEITKLLRETRSMNVVEVYRPVKIVTDNERESAIIEGEFK